MRYLVTDHVGNLLDTVEADNVFAAGADFNAAQKLSKGADHQTMFVNGADLVAVEELKANYPDGVIITLEA